jgi:hypothetical protein
MIRHVVDRDGADQHLESPYERPSRVRKFFRRRSSRAERNQRLVLVGLLTLELKCQAFSSVQTANLGTNNGNKRGNTL